MAIDTTVTELSVTEIYDFEFRNGMVAYFTPHGSSFVYSTHTYQSVPMRRGPIAYHSDLQVDKVEVSLGIVGIIVGTEQFTIPQVIRRDYLRQAKVRIQLIDYNTLQTKFLFEGWISGSISFDQGVLSFSISSILDKLNDKFPKCVYTEFCNHTLFDDYCGLTKADWLSTGLVGAGSDTLNIYSPTFAFSNQAQGYWVRGELKMTSGENITISRTIAEHYDGYVKLLVPYYEVVTTGDAFEVYPGDDKSGQTCDEKFDNYENFLGFEYIPKPEMILG